MWPFSQWTTAGRAALIYITVGILTVVWTGVWYSYLFNNPPTGSAYYWCNGLLVTGVAMVLIGSVLGKISRSAVPHAVLPPAGKSVAVVNLQPNAAPTPVPAPTPARISNAQVVLPTPQGTSPISTHADSDTR